jgi:DNA-binding transcriptional LysR family regulator
MERVDGLRVFMRVADVSSFTLAAEGLGLPKTTVSLAVRELEERVGVRLLHRTTRRVRLTQDGQVFYERAREVVADSDELFTMFQRAESDLTGRLRVDMPTGLAQNLVLPQLPDFFARYPGLDLELSATDRRVDIVREGFDCVVRVGELTDSSLVARPIGKLALVNCASPAYLARRGTPRSVADLARHELVFYTPVLGQRAAGFEWREGDTVHTTPMAGRLSVNNTDAYRVACLAGLGLAQLPWIGVRSLVAAGQLVLVLPDLVAEPMPVNLVFAARRQLSRRVATFMKWLNELIEEELRAAEAAFAAPSPVRGRRKPRWGS